MASSPNIIFFALLLLFLFSFSFAQKPFRPKSLILSVTKDKSTLQYKTVINQRTPLVSSSLVFDLNGPNLWVDCDKDYISTTYKPARCNSAVCSRAGTFGCSQCFSPPKAGCNNNTCFSLPLNTVTGLGTTGEIAMDVVSVQSVDNGSNPGRVVEIPNLVFVCGSTFQLEGLASGTVGIAGMGRHNIGLPSQFAAAFSFNRKFAVCLTSLGRGGVAFFGNGPYVFLPGIKISKLETTPLLVNKFREGEYFIGVSDIRIFGKSVVSNKTLLSIDKVTGTGGTKVSTVDPYTVMQTSIYNAFRLVFVRAAAAMNITRVPSVKPFGACFSTKNNNVGVTRLGYAVPEIEIVLHSNEVVWRIFGANSMVSVRDDVICLGFVDGGANAKTSVVIGGFQLEDNLIEFDLASNRLGFSSTLLGRSTNCANFNFTTTS
ncbi:unnamed protein product [Cochlearia groenlandica]